MSEPVFKTYAEEIAYKRGFVDGDLFAEKRIIKILEPVLLPYEIALIKGEK